MEKLYISLDEDHLRVCGADSGVTATVDDEPGSSPRVRSRLDEHSVLQTLEGIISACAEQTKFTQGLPEYTKDHLRVCGADELAGDND